MAVRRTLMLVLLPLAIVGGLVLSFFGFAVLGLVMSHSGLADSVDWIAPVAIVVAGVGTVLGAGFYFFKALAKGGEIRADDEDDSLEDRA